MNDRRKTVVAICILVGFVLLLAFGVWALFFRSRVVSPMQDTGAIQIIFISPTPVALPSVGITSTGVVSPTVTSKPKATATPKATTTPTTLLTPTITQEP